MRRQTQRERERKASKGVLTNILSSDIISILLSFLRTTKKMDVNKDYTAV